MSRLDVERYRRQFPALARSVAGRPALYLDGPAGSQVPESVARAVGRCLLETNANCGGAFVTSSEADALLAAAHRAVADLLGSDDPELVAFGANMTTLTLAVARAFTRTIGPGDEVLVTQLEHDANHAPWVEAARESGATLREVRLRAEDGTLDLDDLEAQLGPRTRLLAVTAASNALGTVVPMRQVVERAHAVGARVFVDAVHYAPHRRIDVQAWGCDLLVCSAYKFFGPHVGILWGRREVLESWPVSKLRPPADVPPDRWMTGTQNHEGIAGTVAAIDYLAGIGHDHGASAGDRPAALDAAFAAIEEHERTLARRLAEGLASRPDWRLWGIVDPERFSERAPTFAVTHARRRPSEIAETLAAAGIFVWSGHFYALPVTEALGLEPDGVVRIGLLHYNTAAEVDRLLEALD